MARRAGRSRKSGKREANGREIRSASCRELIVPAEHLARRAALVGADLAMSSAAGVAHETMLAWGLLTPRQASACALYRRAVYAYRRTQGMPLATAQIAHIAMLPEGMPDDAEIAEATMRESLTDAERVISDQRRAASAVRRIDDIDRIISDVQPPRIARAVLAMIAIEDHAPETWQQGIVAPIALDCLRRGLDQLAGYFRIDSDGARE